MKISRRKFIQLGAVALAMLGLAKGESVPIVEPTPAEQVYAEALEMIPEFEQLEKQAALGAQIAREHAFTSKDCEQAGQAMMDGFMQGIKSVLSAEDIEKLAGGRDVIEINEQEYITLANSLWAGAVSGIEVTAGTGKGAQVGDIVYSVSRVEFGGENA